MIERSEPNALTELGSKPLLADADKRSIIIKYKDGSTKEPFHRVLASGSRGQGLQNSGPSSRIEKRNPRKTNRTHIKNLTKLALGRMIKVRDGILKDTTGGEKHAATR
jgi:hypothetical protein